MQNPHELLGKVFEMRLQIQAFDPETGKLDVNMNGNRFSMTCAQFQKALDDGLIVETATPPIMPAPTGVRREIHL